MDKHNPNNKNRNPLWANEPIGFGEPIKIKDFFRALTVLVVFFSSLSVPLYISYLTQENTKAIRVKMEMNQIRNWAIVYKLDNDNYDGLEGDKEIIRVFEDIKLMGGVVNIFINANHTKYCCKTEFLNKRLGTWCVDSSGRVGDDGKCSIDYFECE